MVTGSSSPFAPPMSAGSAMRAATLGLGTLPTELISAASAPPPPPGEFVPGYGFQTFTQHTERVALAQAALAMHTPDGPLVALRRAWLPVAVNHHRACMWCRHPWPCPSASWASAARAAAAYGWAL